MPTSLPASKINDWKKSNADHLIIDVREDYEFEEVNIGGKNIPLEYVLSNKDIFNANTHYLFCCKTGKRAAAIAYTVEKKLGMKNIYVLEGGIEAATSQTI